MHFFSHFREKLCYEFIEYVNNENRVRKTMKKPNHCILNSMSIWWLLYSIYSPKEDLSAVRKTVLVLKYIKYSILLMKGVSSWRLSRNF